MGTRHLLSFSNTSSSIGGAGWGRTVRSAGGHRELLLGALGLAHQFLVKPHLSSGTRQRAAVQPQTGSSGTELLAFNRLGEQDRLGGEARRSP
jgi:hypothetical protein